MEIWSWWKKLLTFIPKKVMMLGIGHKTKGEGEEHGLVKLYKEIESCSGYNDIQVMWDMINSSCPPPKANENPRRWFSWRFCLRPT